MVGSKAALCGLLLALSVLHSARAYGPPQRKKTPRPTPSEASPIPSFAPEGSEFPPSPVPSQGPGVFKDPLPVAPGGPAPGQGGDYWWKVPGGPFSGANNPQAGCANGCGPSAPPPSPPVVGCGGGPSSSCGGVPKPAPSGPACGYPGGPGCGGGARPVAPIPPNTGCGHPGAPPCGHPSVTPGGSVKPDTPPDYSTNPFLCSLAGGCKDVNPPHGGSPGTPGVPPHGGRPGYPGSPGNPGSPGFPGTPGSPGSHGTPGSPGSPGFPGTPGSHGKPGSPGSPGFPGTPGSHGNPGSPGSPGFPGTPGSPGSHGSPGSPGSPGYPGTPGSPGSHGTPGSPGTPGFPGTPGSHGSPGSPGFPGTPGTPGTPTHGGSPTYPGSPGSPGFPGSPGVPGTPSHGGSTRPTSGSPTFGGTHPGSVQGSPSYPSGVNPSPQYPGSQPFPTTQRPYTGPLNTTPHPGCAAALKCVQIQYCTADGVMVNYPVSLTREQIENRVPLSDCVNPDTGVIGKCCRDPNYKDPWPDMNTHPVGHDNGPHGGGFPKPTPGGTFPKPVGSGTFPSPGATHPGAPGSVPSFPSKPGVPPTSGGPGFPQQPGSVGGQYPGSGFEQQQQGQFPPLRPGSPKPDVGITHPGLGGIHQAPHPQPSPGINQQPGHGGSPSKPFPQNPPPSFGSNQQKPGFPQQAPPPFGQPGTQPNPYPSAPSSPGSHTPSFPSQPSVPPSQPSFPSQPSIPPSQSPFPSQPSIPPQQKPFPPSQPSIPPSQPDFPSQPSQSQLPPTHTTFPSSPSGPSFPNKPPSSGFPNQPSGTFPSTPTDESFPSQVSVGTFPTQPIHSDSQSVPYGTCGVRRGHPTNPDVGPTQFGEFPWHAMVLARANASRSALCSGVIISEKAILTAAHCVAGLLPADVFVRVAEWRPWSDSKTEEPVAVVDAGVIAIAKHPSFELNSLFSDLAILFLSEHLPAYGPAIEPICIPGQPGAGTPIGGAASPSSCLATSWGKTTLSGGDHGPLHKVGLSLIGHAPCEQKMRQTHLGKFFILHQSFQCSVFYPPEQALPQVDDGSPLVCQTPDGHYILQGISSWTIGAAPSQTSVFAQIDYIWIRETLSRPVEEFFPKQEEQNELVDTSKKPGFSQGYGRK